MEELVQIKIRVEEGVDMPKYQTNEAGGFDISFNKILKVYRNSTECFELLMDKQVAFQKYETITLLTDERVLLGTGIFMDIPTGYSVEIRTRSSVALKTPAVVSQGTIDSDYVDKEVGIIISNNTQYPVTFRKGDRLAQCIVNISPKVVLQKVESIEARVVNRQGGYGSTNI
jgi:dUTP pyrophosphatase